MQRMTKVAHFLDSKLADRQLEANEAETELYPLTGLNFFLMTESYFLNSVKQKTIIFSPFFNMYFFILYINW